ncbi:helix-turn-helix domain-containing protein [Domibacillus enclensis]|uniref:Transcriptional regulator n=1 Tax=Domibacillus enclensis TaxID=1017273 RepID=A0A1N7C5F1_9BACI|nr:helix-turn-helix domain-containing protein [Domibacillus enclensis]OXS74244.1 transcriptional regulator [Domibacillus enclensis]SIR58703.1 DNA-binding transcriptional regulator, XRE-family HTH domain [Domibacillus enclensis]
MNRYLLELGSNISNIRNCLSFTQEEFAQALGISRPTVIKIEQDPTKMTKNIALAMFVAVQAEIETNKQALDSMKTSDYANPEKAIKLISGVASGATMVSSGALTVGIASLPLAGLIGLGTAMSTVGNVLNKLKKNKKSEEESNEELKQLQKKIDIESLKGLWNEQTAEKIINMAKENLIKKEKECLACFDLERWSNKEYVERIIEGSVE